MFDSFREYTHASVELSSYNSIFLDSQLIIIMFLDLVWLLIFAYTKYFTYTNIPSYIIIWL